MPSTARGPFLNWRTSPSTSMLFCALTVAHYSPRFGSVRAAQEEVVTEHVPQHDPPPGSELIQPEVDERDDSLVVSGDDVDHVLPPTELDPFTPDTTQTAKQRTALWIALAVIAVAIVVIVVLALR